ncbi:MAG: flavin monoamine oxidase family protein [Pseudonocardiales bacterium]|nr:flavin monoamine oxidase family protein [Pseudonocardiales bacterium]
MSDREQRSGAEQVDVVVVGAGLAGMTAGLELCRRGHTIRVLEAKDRVGGRVFGVPIGYDEMIELGGQFVGPTQNHILNLINELGLTKYPTHVSGDHIYYRNNRPIRYDTSNGPIPPENQQTIAELLNAVTVLESMAVEVSPDAPWECPKAAEWDAISFQEWANSVATLPGARMLIDYVTRGTTTCEPSDLSLLYMLNYVAAAGNDDVVGSLSRVIVTAGGATMHRIVGGSQRIPELLAANLGDSLSLFTPVRRITQHDQSVIIHTEDREITAQRVIVATPPFAANQIEYDPPLPTGRRELAERLLHGAQIKACAVFDRPFWRDTGLSGYVVSDSGPVQNVWDNTPVSGTPGVLMCFIKGNAAANLNDTSDEILRKKIVDNLVAYFGPNVAEPQEIFIKRWHQEPWIMGCPGSLAPPGLLTAQGRTLREPVGRIHWSGTETAKYWQGFMDGAVSAGNRAAAEVAAQLT